MGKTAYRKLKEEAKQLNLAYQGSEFDRMMATCLCGKVHFAAELGLIDSRQWEELFDKATALLDGD